MFQLLLLYFLFDILHTHTFRMNAREKLTFLRQCESKYCILLCFCWSPGKHLGHVQNNQFISVFRYIYLLTNLDRFLFWILFSIIPFTYSTWKVVEYKEKFLKRKKKGERSCSYILYCFISTFPPPPISISLFLRLLV